MAYPSKNRVPREESSSSKTIHVRWNERTNGRHRFLRSRTFRSYRSQFSRCGIIEQKTNSGLEMKLSFPPSSLKNPRLGAQFEGIGSNRCEGTVRRGAARFVKRREILFTRNAAGNARRAKGGGRIESHRDHRVFECTSARLGTRNCFDIEFAREIEGRLQHCGNS